MRYNKKQNKKQLEAIQNKIEPKRIVKMAIITMFLILFQSFNIQ